MQITRYLLLGLLTVALITPSLARGDDRVKAAMNRAAQNYFRQAMMLGTDGDDAGAVRALRQAVSCNADFPEAYSMLGSSLARLGKYPEAEKALRRAVKIKPDYAEGYYYLGLFLKNRGRTQEAEQAFQKAKQLQR